MHTLIFYILAAVILAATIMAITRRDLVHAVLYLVVSFFGSAMLLYLFGAPFLAAMEIIIYAGAIMILFLFIIMMTDMAHLPEQLFPPGQVLPALAMAVVYTAAGAVLLAGDADLGAGLRLAMAGPREFGRYVLEQHWLMVEVVSLLLLVALIGALHLGKAGTRMSNSRPIDPPGGHPDILPDVPPRLPTQEGT